MGPTEPAPARRRCASRSSAIPRSMRPAFAPFHMCGVFEQERQGKMPRAGMVPLGYVGHIRDVDIATADRLKLLIPTEELAGWKTLIFTGLRSSPPPFSRSLDRLPNVLVSRREVRREGQLECLAAAAVLGLSRVQQLTQFDPKSSSFRSLIRNWREFSLFRFIDELEYFRHSGWTSSTRRLRGGRFP